MIFTEFILKGRILKNHIVFPPVVCYGWCEDALVTQQHIEHYKNVARGGVGLIIVESSCVSSNARLGPSELGIWEDKFIDGFAAIAKVCHSEGVPVLAQIHHAGSKTTLRGNDRVGPSELRDDNEKVTTKELSSDQIQEIEDQFIRAAKRMQAAGMDGIELHGAHGYLISYFLSNRMNRRRDTYGGTLENQAKFVVNIVKGIRRECGEDFIIGIRYGGATPTLEDGIGLAQIFEKAGCDILHISHGVSADDVVEIPEEFSEYISSTYTAVEIKKYVRIPVIAANKITTIERARKLVDRGFVDFAAIATSILADYNWPDKVNKGEPFHVCRQCQPRCLWFKTAKIYCPAQNAVKSKTV